MLCDVLAPISSRQVAVCFYCIPPTNFLWGLANEGHVFLQLPLSAALQFTNITHLVLGAHPRCYSAVLQRFLVFLSFLSECSALLLPFVRMLVLKFRVRKCAFMCG